MEKESNKKQRMFYNISSLNHACFRGIDLLMFI